MNADCLDTDVCLAKTQTTSAAQMQPILCQSEEIPVNRVIVGLHNGRSPAARNIRKDDELFLGAVFVVYIY